MDFLDRFNLPKRTGAPMWSSGGDRASDVFDYSQGMPPAPERGLFDMLTGSVDMEKILSENKRVLGELEALSKNLGAENNYRDAYMRNMERLRREGVGL